MLFALWSLTADAATCPDDLTQAMGDLEQARAERSAARQQLYGQNWGYLEAIGDRDAVRLAREQARDRLVSARSRVREAREALDVASADLPADDLVCEPPATGSSAS